MPVKRLTWVAYAWGLDNLQTGDEIILSVMEHHSNLIPWQMIAQRTGAVLKFVELTETEEFDLDQYRSLLSDRTKLVSVVHVSNTLGCINPVKEIIHLAHGQGAKVLIDACQSTFPIWPWMFRRWIVIGWWPVDIRCVRPLALGFSMAKRMCFGG